MAPVSDPLGAVGSLSSALDHGLIFPVVACFLAILLLVLVLMVCADGGDKNKTKPKKMIKLDQGVNFSDINKSATSPARGATSATTAHHQGTSTATSGGSNTAPAKLRLRAEIPPQQSSPSVPQYVNIQQGAGGAAPQRLAVDALEIMRQAFKKDSSLKQLEVDERRLVTSDIIGSGNFGVVYKGTLYDKNMNRPREVAVKTVQGQNCSKEDLEMFIKESVKMRGFAHENVMCVCAIVTRDNKPFIVLPYMHNGDLRSYVAHKTRKLNVEELIRFGSQVAQGMAYLSSKNFIHRDLAARNCMVSHDMIVKVSDFGLSRDLYSADYYRMTDLKTPLPIRWVALEAILTSKFTTKSDVWSFGVLLWELMTRGKNPYPDIRQHVEVLQYIRDGKRLECPHYVPDDLKQLMSRCWLVNPSDRPSFVEICNSLHRMLHDDGDYLKPQPTKRS